MCQMVGIKLVRGTADSVTCYRVLLIKQGAPNVHKLPMERLHYESFPLLGYSDHVLVM